MKKTATISIGKAAKGLISTVKKSGSKSFANSATKQKFSTSTGKKNVARLRQDINTTKKMGGKAAAGISSLRKK